MGVLKNSQSNLHFGHPIGQAGPRFLECSVAAQGNLFGQTPSFVTKKTLSTSSQRTPYVEPRPPSLPFCGPEAPTTRILQPTSPLLSSLDVFPLSDVNRSSGAPRCRPLDFCQPFGMDQSDHGRNRAGFRDSWFAAESAAL